MYISIYLLNSTIKRLHLCINFFEDKAAVAALHFAFCCIFFFVFNKIKLMMVKMQHNTAKLE